MSIPIFLFEDLIRASGGGLTHEGIKYYYHKEEFWGYRDIGIVDTISNQRGGYLLEALGDCIDFDNFKYIYERLSKKYCLNEEKINVFMREYQLKKLLS